MYGKNGLDANALGVTNGKKEKYLAKKLREKSFHDS